MSKKLNLKLSFKIRTDTNGGNQRGRDNTMAKTKGTKSHTMIDKTPHRKPHDCATSMHTLNLPRFLVWFVLLDI